MIPVVFADTGPHTAADLNFEVILENHTVQGNFTGQILACYDKDACTWKVDNSALCKNGMCTFVYYRIERVPSTFKLNLEIPGTGNLTSNAVQFNYSLNQFYRAEINKSGLFISGMPVSFVDYVITSPTSSSWLLLSPLLSAILITIIVELVVAVIMLRHWKIDTRKWLRPLTTISVADIITVPLVWLIFFLLLFVITYININAILAILLSTILSEAAAVLAEARIIFLFNKKILSSKRAFWLSLISNLCSFILGGLILATMGL